MPACSRSSWSCAHRPGRVPADLPAPKIKQPTRFLLLYPLAYAGDFVAYVPFLTILLPIKMAAVAGDTHIEWRAEDAAFSGAGASDGHASA